MRKQIKKEEYKNVVPVFYAADNNYLPYLGVALAALRESGNAENYYKVHVLYFGTLGEDKEKILAMQRENFSVEFYDMTEKIAQIEHLIHCRDYYTCAIYFRLFIPDTFPQYDKAVYLDCDTIILNDVAKLYERELGDNLVGAVADQAVAATPAFCDYVKYALGIAPEKYFNSGVLTLNLKKLREMNFYSAFFNLLASYRFTVAPDQDCLNILCKDRVLYYDKSWNAMPVAGRMQTPNLVHYNFCKKPWHYSGIVYEEYFWQFANQSEFFDVIAARRASFTPLKESRDDEGAVKLIALAQAEADSPNNYLNEVKNKKEDTMYAFIENIAPKKSLVKAD